MAVILVITAGAAVIIAQRRITASTRDYAARQVAALEEERGRVARELHDDVSQQIALLSQRLNRVHDALQERPEDPMLLTETEEAGDNLRDLAESVRDLAHRMHPSALDHLGLGPALQDLAFDTVAGSALRIDVEIGELPAEPATGPALAIYRIAQEALRNVRKHAGATRASLRVGDADNGILLEISDDGIGFLPEDTARSTGLGMVSMRERLRLVGGDLNISSVPGRGTVVRAWVPRAAEGGS